MRNFLRKSKIVLYLAKRSFWIWNKLFKSYFYIRLPAKYQTNPITLKATYNTIFFLYFLHFFCQLQQAWNPQIKIKNYKKLLIKKVDYLAGVIAELIDFFEVVFISNKWRQKNNSVEWSEFHALIKNKFNYVLPLINHRRFSHQVSIYQLTYVVYQMNLNLVLNVKLNQHEVLNIVGIMDQIKEVTEKIIGKYNNYLFTFYLQAIYL